MIGICGASGFIGHALFEHLIYKGKTVLGTYCHNSKPGMVRFDIRKSGFDIFDKCEIVVVLSAYAKIKFCEENKVEAFFVNVFQTCKLLSYLNDKGIPALFISSDASVRADLMDTTYGKYKKIVEKYIKKKGLKCEYIRPGKITKDNVKELCDIVCEQIWAYKGRKD